MDALDRNRRMQKLRCCTAENICFDGFCPWCRILGPLCLGTSTLRKTDSTQKRFDLGIFGRAIKHFEFTNETVDSTSPKAAAYVRKNCKVPCRLESCFCTRVGIHLCEFCLGYRTQGRCSPNMSKLQNNRTHPAPLGQFKGRYYPSLSWRYKWTQLRYA